MNDKTEDRSEGLEPRQQTVRSVRADAQRNNNARALFLIVTL